MTISKSTSIKSHLIFLVSSVAALFLIIACIYYFYVFNLITEKQQVYVQNLIAQVVENIETSSDDMIRCARLASNNNDTQQYLYASTSLELLKNSKKVSNALSMIVQDSQGLSIVILENDSKMVLTAKPVLTVLDKLEEQYGIYDSKNGAARFTGAIHNMYDDLTYYAYYQPIMDVTPTAKPMSQVGTCVVLSTIARLEKCISQVDTSPNSVFIIMDENQDIVVSNMRSNPEKADLVSKTIRTGNIKSGAIQKIGGKAHRVLFQEVPTTKWKVICAIPRNEITSELAPFLTFGTIILIVVLFVFIVWGIHIFRSVALPIVEISNFVQKDAYVNLHSRLNLKKKNEIGQLADQINFMLDKISDMTRTILHNQSNMYELDIAKKRAELSALQSQINPHFLYNTLDCIKGYGYQLGSDEIVSIVESLSKIMRYCIKGPDVVALADEILIIRCYLEIILIRFDNRFNFTLNIGNENMGIELPRFLLQPIVENAIYHGLEPKYGGGSLNISLEELGEKELIILISDDGVGMSDEALNELREKLAVNDVQSLFSMSSKHGLALLNINQQIKKFFGNQYGLIIESNINQGTTVKVHICRKEKAI